MILWPFPVLNVKHLSELRDALDEKIKFGEGAPESVVTASRGCMYLRTDGGAGTTFYVKETGDNTNTGWTAK